jgi:hypothetical protein
MFFHSQEIPGSCGKPVFHSGKVLNRKEAGFSEG